MSRLLLMGSCSHWLNKFKSYLNLGWIDGTSPTALAEQFELKIAVPDEDFYYSLQAEQKATFYELHDALMERFSNDKQSWVMWQAVLTHQAGITRTT